MIILYRDVNTQHRPNKCDTFFSKIEWLFSISFPALCDISTPKKVE